jgi:hypothetical protein
VAISIDMLGHFVLRCAVEGLIFTMAMVNEPSFRSDVWSQATATGTSKCHRRTRFVGLSEMFTKRTL